MFFMEPYVNNKPLFLRVYMRYFSSEYGRPETAKILFWKPCVRVKGADSDFGCLILVSCKDKVG